MPAVADIISISAPVEAAVGQNVNITVNVKNISNSEMYLGCTGVYDSTELSWQQVSLLVGPGESKVFWAWPFIMPNKTIRVTVSSRYWNGTEWIQDDSAYCDIALVTLTPQFQGFGVIDYSTS